MRPNEQLEKQGGHGSRKAAKRRKYVKRSTGKNTRRLGKKHLEDAPPRATEGWDN